MKVFGQDQLTEVAPIDKMLRYALSLPVSLASVGMPRREFIEFNVELARNFKPMTAGERQELHDSIAQHRKVAMSKYLQEHSDA
jgi:hypothetical protein